MAEFAFPSAQRLAHHSLCLIAAGSLLGGCEREGADTTRQIDGMKADMEESKRRISHIQNSLASKDGELAENIQALEAAKAQIVDLQKAIEERNGQLRAAKTEIDELKKRDAIVFGEIVALQQRGQSVVAVSRYQKFITDYPKSPLVVNAKDAITQLTELPPELKKQVPLPADPAKREREFSKTFNEGYMTLQEIAPYVKKKSLAQVLALLGKPNQSFRDNTEIGYIERAINPATGSRGMLVVAFEEGVVASLRVEYAGRKVVP